MEAGLLKQEAIRLSVLNALQKKGQMVVYEDYDEKENIVSIRVDGWVDHFGVKASISKSKMVPWTPDLTAMWSLLLDEWLRKYALFILERNEEKKKNYSESTSSASAFVKPE